MIHGFLCLHFTMAATGINNRDRCLFHVESGPLRCSVALNAVEWEILNYTPGKGKDLPSKVRNVLDLTVRRNMAYDYTVDWEILNYTPGKGKDLPSKVRNVLDLTVRRNMAYDYTVDCGHALTASLGLRL